MQPVKGGKLSLSSLILAAICVLLASVAIWASIQANKAGKSARIATETARKSEERAKESEQRAKAQTLIATSRYLAACSALERNRRLDRALLLAVEACRTANTAEACDSLLMALQNRPKVSAFLHIEEKSISSVAFSPDGTIIAAGYEDSAYVEEAGGVMLWDTAGRRRLPEAPLIVEEGSVNSVAFSPDGKTIAAGYVGAENVTGVVLWDTATRHRLTVDALEVSEGDVYSVAYSPDGKMIAAGYGGLSGGGVVLWDAASRRRLAAAPLRAKEGHAHSVAFSPDSKIIAAGCGRGVVLWDAANRKRLTEAQLVVNEGEVNSVAFSPDGKTIAAGYGSVGPGAIGIGGVVLWDTAGRTRLPESPLTVKQGSVISVTFSPDGKTIAAACGFGGNGVMIWDVASRERIADFPLTVREGSVSSVAFSPDGKTIAAGYRPAGPRFVGPGGVVLWNAAGGMPLAEAPLRVKDDKVSSVAFSPDGKAIAAGSDRGLVAWDAASRTLLAESSLAVKKAEVHCVVFSPNGKLIATDYDGGVVLWDAAGPTLLAGAPLTVKDCDVSSVVFSPDSKTIAAGYNFQGNDSRVGGVVVWDVASRTRLAESPLAVNAGYVNSMAFSTDGETIAVGYGVMDGDGARSGGVIVLSWKAAGHILLMQDSLTVKEGWVYGVAFSPDGKVDRGRMHRKRLHRQSDTLGRSHSPAAYGGTTCRRRGRRSSVAFSPDGKTIAAGYGIEGPRTPGDGRVLGGVVLWDMASRTRLAEVPFPMYEGEALSLAFSPDGKKIAAGYGGGDIGGGVVLWDVDPESWQRKAGQIANRNFTRDEWRQYFHDEPYHPTFPDLPVPPADHSQHKQGRR